MTRRWVGMGMAIALVGCGSKVAPPTPGGDGGPPTGTQPVTITLGPFTVPGGSEVFKCQNFANPFGRDVEVRKFESHMTPGSHHLLLYYRAGATNGSIQDCSGLEFSATPYGAQTPDARVAYPPGIAALVPQTQGFRLQLHYLNTTTQDFAASATVTFHLAEPGTVTAHAGVLFFNNLLVYVPADPTPRTVTRTCEVPHDVHLLVASSHMHEHGTRFVASVEGQTIYETTEWSDPVPRRYDPPLAVGAGQGISWSCTYVNNTGAPLYFGESARDNEMCIFSAQFYPVLPGGRTMIECGTGGL